MNTAIIVAAGEGTRFGSDRPKQFVEVCGKPLIVHTIERFAASPNIHNIILVVSASGRALIEEFAQDHSVLNDVTVVEGGPTMTRGSERNSLRWDCRVRFAGEIRAHQSRYIDQRRWLDRFACQ